MIREHDIVGKMSKKEFLEKVRKFNKNNIETTEHTFFRLSEKQRKIYEPKILKDIILKEEPLEIWEQRNGNLAVLYIFKENKLLKLLLRFSSNKVYIVTFYILNKRQREEVKIGKK